MVQSTTWIAHFPGLQRLPADPLSVLANNSSIVALPAGSRIYGPGQSPENYLLMLGACPSNSQIALVRKARVGFCLGDEQNIPRLED